MTMSDLHGPTGPGRGAEPAAAGSDEPPTHLDGTTPGSRDEPPTHLDGAAPAGGDEPPTHLDGGGDGPHGSDGADPPAEGVEPPTHLDGDDASDRGWSDGNRLPPELAARFPDAVPRRAGAQAFTFLASTPDGEAVLIRVARVGVAGAADDVDLSTLRSPHLVRVLEVGSASGAAYQILDFIEGPTLSSFLEARRTPLTEPVVRSLVAQLSDGIATLGRAGLLHRDLKPANIVVEGPDRLVPRLVIVDFGLIQRAVHTLMEGIAGMTPQYAEPAAFVGVVTRQCDWWSLGMVVAELLLGHHLLGRDVADRPPVSVALALINGWHDTGEVTDPRWSMLVRGLLTTSHEHRWGHAEVTEWLAGGSPPVHAHATGGDHTPGSTPTAAAVAPAAPAFNFAGREHRRDPRRLADALGSNHDDAIRLLGSPEARASLARWCRQFDDADLLVEVDRSGPGGRLLRRDLIAVIAALYRVDRRGRRGVGPRWYQGEQLTPSLLHQFADDALQSAEALIDNRAESDLGETPTLQAVVRLLDGDLAMLAEGAGPASELARIHRELEAGVAYLRRGTERLAEPRQDWELTLWSIQLLRCLTGPNAAVALAEEARLAVRRRRDLAQLVSPRSAPAQHLLVTILVRRQPRRGRVRR